MTTYLALLRAVNVGGTGALPMTTLKRLCEAADFGNVRTYIQSGNVVFESSLATDKVRTILEVLLTRQLGKPAQVFVRTASALQKVLASTPFPGAEPNQVLVFFFNKSPQKAAINAVAIPGKEQLVLRGKELYVHYPDGMGPSKLKVPHLDQATGRNLNTVRKLAEISHAK